MKRIGPVLAFKSRDRIRNGVAMFRGHLHVDLPENPVCWAIGHTPRARVIDSRYIDSWVLLDCRVCGRRYNQRAEVLQLDPAIDWKDVARQRVEVCRRDPALFAQGADRRQGWDKATAEFSAELIARRPRVARVWDHLSVKLHLGNASSETPIDAHLDLGLLAAYVSVGGVGGRFAEWVGRGHKRTLSLSVFGGQLWWKVWYDDDGGHDRYHECDQWRDMPWTVRRKYHSWACLRDGNIDLNPLDVLWGGRRNRYVDVGESVTTFIEPAPGDRYLVDFQLQRGEAAREHGPAWARRKRVSWSVSWDARPGGIPFRNDSWKGDETYAGSFGLELNGTRPGPVSRWLPMAVARLEEDVRRDRRRYRYVAPAEARA